MARSRTRRARRSSKGAGGRSAASSGRRKGSPRRPGDEGTLWAVGDELDAAARPSFKVLDQRVAFEGVEGHLLCAPALRVSAAGYGPRVVEAVGSDRIAGAGRPTPCPETLADPSRRSSSRPSDASGRTIAASKVT